jgi:hypothetical protein
MRTVAIVPIPQIDDGIRLVAIDADDVDTLRDDAAAIDGIAPLGAIDAWPGDGYWEWAIPPRTRAARAALLEALDELQEQER